MPLLAVLLPKNDALFVLFVCSMCKVHVFMQVRKIRDKMG